MGQNWSSYDGVANTNVKVSPASWSLIGSMQETNGIFRYSDIGVITNQVRRFYRAQQTP